MWGKNWMWKSFIRLLLLLPVVVVVNTTAIITTGTSIPALLQQLLRLVEVGLVRVSNLMSWSNKNWKKNLGGTFPRILYFAQHGSCWYCGSSARTNKPRHVGVSSSSSLLLFFLSQCETQHRLLQGVEYEGIRIQRSSQQFARHPFPNFPCRTVNPIIGETTFQGFPQ